MHPKAAKEAVAEVKPKFYPAEDVSKPLKRKFARRQTKLRASITPGTVLILLAGRFAGKRVVCLGQLPSGLLLVTGPFKLSGVQVRRVNASYVIATSTKVDVKGVDTAKVTDALFAKPKKSTPKTKDEDKFFGTPAKKTLDASFVALQKSVDASIAAAIDKNADMKSYFKARFSLSSGDRPHAMKF